eukprot:22804-Rhodomonas_salina.1
MLFIASIKNLNVTTGFAVQNVCMGSSDKILPRMKSDRRASSHVLLRRSLRAWEWVAEWGQHLT